MDDAESIEMGSASLEMDNDNKAYKENEKRSKESEASDDHESFSAEEMENMKGVGTCKICQGMHSGGGEVCDRCEKMPAGTMCVFTAHAVNIDDEDSTADGQMVLQGMGIALVASDGAFPFVDGAVYRVIVQGET